MALYHFSAKIISRANGQSACAAIAYRSGEKIFNEYDGITHDYRKKQNVEFSVIMLPDNAPEKYKDRQVLWNAVEANNKGSNAQLAREVEFSLPRELPQEIRQKIALEFIQEQFVSEGMIADVCFHNPPKMNSKKQPVDKFGNVVTSSDEYVYENPHVHVMLSLRPMDESGKWMATSQKHYICEKDGQQKVMSGDEYKNSDGWSKLYQYKDQNGVSRWLTKSYVSEHPEESLTLVSKYPQEKRIMNPVYQKWNSKDTLLHWREAWAQKINLAYEEHGLQLSVDHRSYEAQGNGMIPTVHEGKHVTFLEKKFAEEYIKNLEVGLPVTENHTDVRSLNLAIREHNKEIIILNKINELNQKMRLLLSSVTNQMKISVNTIAEKLEHLRAEIIQLGINIKESVTTRNRAEYELQTKQSYIDELQVVLPEQLKETELQLETLKLKLETLTHSVFHKHQKEQLINQIEILEYKLNVYKENKLYSSQITHELNHMKDYCSKLTLYIEDLQSEYNDKISKYEVITMNIPEDELEDVIKERITIRNKVEEKYSFFKIRNSTNVIKEIDTLLNANINAEKAAEKQAFINIRM